MQKALFKKLCTEKILILDGATGTELQKAGLPTGVCPEKWVIENPGALIGIQREYIDSGSDIVYSCSFGANRIKLKDFGFENEVFEMNKKLAEISRKAVELSGREAFVAGDMSPTGEMIYPIGSLDFEQAVEIYKEQAGGLIAGGVDLFIIETMLDVQETRAAIIAVKEICDLPVMATFTLEPNGKTLTGADPVAALITLQTLGADAVGVNCSTGPDDMIGVLREMKPYAKVPLISKANAGIPIFEDGVTKYSMNPEQFAGHIPGLIEAGANIIGGCCGTNAEFIKLIRQSADGKQPGVYSNTSAVLTSARKVLDISKANKTLVTGERINPTGKKALQSAIIAGNYNSITELAMEQAEKGADILDVNLGMSGISEADVMREAVYLLSSSVDLPLCIDSSDPNVIEAALRVYPGRALVNSVSLEKKKIDEILPVAANYGAMIITLPLSDEGIPDDVEERKNVFLKIFEEAQKYGYTKEDIVVDGLVMTVSADQKAAKTTIDIVNWCSGFGVNTVMGLSNVSFGLPQRSSINAAFLSMAIYNGLSLVIANPSNADVMLIKQAADVLKGKDENALSYIAVHGKTAPVAVDLPEETSTLKKVCNAILKGSGEAIIPMIRTAMNEGTPAKEIIEDYLIPAITEVGDLYEQQKYFLPQLILSAKTMELAFDFLQPYLTEDKSEATAKPAKVILATVKGDIHDIGKNIVKLMLKNNGFEVIDLGKDVSAEEIAQAAAEENADVVGLSALMTTTMVEMRNVIAKLKEKGAKAKIMIGGAVITEQYAKQIGADAYSEDAAHAVRVVKELCR